MPKSQLERLSMIGAAFLAFILIVFGYLVFISPQRSQTSTVNGQVATAQQQNNTLQARIQALSAQNEKLSTYEKAVASASAALPSTSGVPDFLRSLQAIGNATLSDVTQLTVGAPTQYVAPVVAAAAPTGTASPSPTPTPAATSTTASPAASIYVLAVTAQVTGSNAHLSEFLRQLQSVQPRAVLISQITETTGSGGGASGTSTVTAGEASLQLTMSIFIQPNAAAALPTGTGTP